MKNTIEFTQQQYQELIELVLIGEKSKTKDIIPINYEHIVNQPSTLLKNYILSQADKFNSEHLIQYHQELEGQYFLKHEDELLEEYLDM